MNLRMYFQSPFVWLATFLYSSAWTRPVNLPMGSVDVESFDDGVSGVAGEDDLSGGDGDAWGEDDAGVVVALAASLVAVAGALPAGSGDDSPLAGFAFGTRADCGGSAFGSSSGWSSPPTGIGCASSSFFFPASLARRDFSGAAGMSSIFIPLPPTISRSVSSSTADASSIRIGRPFVSRRVTVFLYISSVSVNQGESSFWNFTAGLLCLILSIAARDMTTVCFSSGERRATA